MIELVLLCGFVFGYLIWKLLDLTEKDQDAK
jgi:hypothetical protein